MTGTVVNPAPPGKGFDRRQSRLAQAERRSLRAAVVSARSSSRFAVYAIVAAFGTYFCMYAFRKPFAVGRFEGLVDLPILPPMDYKILLIVTQLLGYMSSKFIGIKVVSELHPARRAWAIVACITVAELALLLFAITPRPWAAVWLLLNGLPLGMVWGLTFGFLEGRRQTELLGAGLSASYIVASGYVKSVGKWVLDAGVTESSMPFVVGLVFFPALLGFVWMLSRIPAPSREDERERVRREPMGGQARVDFVASYTPGLVLLTVLYFFLTAYRDFRDNFARELWDALGFADRPEIFAQAELPIAFGVLLVLAAVTWIRDNRRALLVIHWIMGLGTLLIGVSTALYQQGYLGPAAWMISVGFGLYVAYVPYGCVLFDRMIATVGVVATAGFMIYVTDAVGYLGSVSIYFYKTFAEPDLSWKAFFIGFSYWTSGLCTVCFVLSGRYFAALTTPRPPKAGAE
jgi:MFS family permease